MCVVSNVQILQILLFLQAAALLEQDPEPQAVSTALGSSRDGADVLQIEDSGDALDVDLDDPFQAQMLDISQPMIADEQVLQALKQQACYACCIVVPPCHFHV